MAYDLGDTVTDMWGEVRDAAGALTTAATAALTVTKPDLTEETVTVTNPSTGVYGADYVPTVEGIHRWWLHTTGPATAKTGSFHVNPVLDASIVSLSDAKTQLNITDNSDDEELRRICAAATAAVERHLDMVVAPRVITERRDLGNPATSATPGLLQKFTLTRKPVLALTSVQSADGGTTWNTADMRVTPAGVVEVRTGAVVWGPVDFVYRAGTPVIAAEHTEAAEIIIQHIWQTQRGTQGGPRPGGMDTSGLGFTSYGYAIPNAALELLGDRIGGLA